MMALVDIFNVTMSDAATDSENVASPGENESPSPIMFLLPAGLWSKCQMQPFRLLDLPAELRNNICDHAFTGFHSLSPHHLTQVNRQVAAESTQLYLEGTHTLQIPLQVPAQMTCFLKWIEKDIAYSLPSSEMAYEFTNTDIDVGVTTIRFTQGIHSPAVRYGLIRSRAPEMSEEHVVLATWYCFIGIFYESLSQDFGESMLGPPPSRFLEAVDDGAMWTHHKMEFVGESEPSFPATSTHAKKFFLFFIKLMTEISSEGWHKKYLRRIAGILFMRSMETRLMAKRKA